MKLEKLCFKYYIPTYPLCIIYAWIWKDRDKQDVGETQNENGEEESGGKYWSNKYNENIRNALADLYVQLCDQADVVIILHYDFKLCICNFTFNF